MPVVKGSIWAQFVSQSFITEGNRSFTFRFNFRDISAYSGISSSSFRHSDGNVDPLTVISSGITDVISNGSSVDIDEPQASIVRNQVSSITFTVSATTLLGDNTRVRGYHVINFWNLDE